MKLPPDMLSTVNIDPISTKEGWRIDDYRSAECRDDCFYKNPELANIDE